MAAAVRCWLWTSDASGVASYSTFRSKPFGPGQIDDLGDQLRSEPNGRESTSGNRSRIRRVGKIQAQVSGGDDSRDAEKSLNLYS